MTPTDEDLLALADRLDGIEIYSVRENRSILGTRPIEAANNAVCEAAAALRAIVAERQKPLAVKVKPLVWVDFNDRGAKAQAWGEANYLIQRWSDGRYELSASYPGYCTDIPGGGFYPSKESALAAAEADHAARVLSQIEAVPVARIRAEALDDAARAASNRAAYWWAEAAAADDTGRKKLSLSYEAKALACTELAAVIRVLKGTKA